MKVIDILSTIKPFGITVVAVIMFVLGSGVLMAQTSISGNVFEDVNYGGGSGRSKISSSGVGIQYAADVELYNSNGEYMSGTNTDENGDYSITGLAAGTYYVRVVTDSVRSSRTGWTTNCKPVMTYRTNAASGTAVAVTDFVGGTNPSANDPGVGSSGATFNTSTFEYSTVLSGTAQAVTQCILTSSDITGVNFGFNYNTIVNTNNSSQGSLRQVITNMNTLGDDANLLQSGLVVAKDNAVFMISDGTSAPGLRSANNYFSGGIATISPTSAFPTISSTLVLDAQRQPSWTSTPVIELNGTNAGVGAKGLELTGGSSIVRGFIINRFTGNSSSAGIWISTNGSNTIQGNYIGTNSAGNSASANYQGIYISGTTGNFIGGTSMTQRNVLSGNTWRGIGLYAGTSGNTVRGNYVGVNAAGTTAIPNNIGISVWSSPNNTIGGSLTGEGNVLSGNLNFGVYFVSSAASGNTVQGNIIGLNATQSGSVPNGSSGIELYGPGDGGSNNIIGGTGAGNVISGNGGVGIKLRGGSGNLILQNSIYANNGIGIDLNADSISLNNGTKNSTLPNYEMDFPVFSSAKLNGTTLTFEGYVGSSPSQSTFANAIVEIFKSDNDLSGYGEGQIYLGRDTCDANGNFSGSFIVTLLSVGDKITGTATDESNNTSEFGANYSVTGFISYYSKGSLAVNTPSNWNTARDGSGTNATSFGIGNTWIIQNTDSMILTGSNTWDVSASGTVQIENGGSWTNSSSSTVTIGTFQVDNGGSYSHGTSNTLPGTFKSFGTTSTVNYSGTNQTVSSLDYGNLTLSNSGTKTFAAGTVAIGGDLDVRDLAVVDALTYNDTVEYFGTNKTVRYGFVNKNLQISGDCVVTSNTDLSATNSLVINSGSTFNMNGYALSVNGAIINNGNYISTNPSGSMSFYSKNSGDFNSLNSWSNGGYSSVTTTRLPGTVNNDVLIIGNNKTINLTSSISNLGTVRIDSAGTLNPGNHIINGSGQFDLRKGGNLRITIPGGIDSSTGNIQTEIKLLNDSANYVFCGSVSQVTGSDFPANACHLIIDNASGVALSNNTRLTGDLSLTQGSLKLGDNNLTLGFASSIIGAPSNTRMIVASGNGLLIKEFSGVGSFTFPVGDNIGAAEYSPVTLDFTSGTFSSAYAGVNVVNAKHPHNSSIAHFINRYWTVSSSGITNFSCNVTFNYTDTDIQSGADETRIYAGHYNSSNWTVLNQANTSSNELTGTVSSFSDFTAGELGALTVVNAQVNLTPKSFALSQNYPNPFNPSTKISWQSPVSSWQTLKVYDILGNEVATLVNEFREAGFYEMEFDGSQFSSGVYIYKINTSDFSDTKKMILTK